MKMWETKCVGCGEMTPANQCPQVGCYVPSEKRYKNSLCKPCWLKHNPLQLNQAEHGTVNSGVTGSIPVGGVWVGVRVVNGGGL